MSYVTFALKRCASLWYAPVRDEGAQTGRG